MVPCIVVIRGRFSDKSEIAGDGQVTADEFLLILGEVLLEGVVKLELLLLFGIEPAILVNYSSGYLVIIDEVFADNLFSLMHASFVSGHIVDNAVQTRIFSYDIGVTK